jgi:hypothetical protein
MNAAIQNVAKEMNIDVREFTVAGIPEDGLFSHKWYVGTNDPVNSETLRQKLDEKLKLLNDDYRVSRESTLKNIYVEVLPINLFYDWMKKLGKEGGMNKFPRVLQNEKLKDWQEFVNANAAINFAGK